METIRHTDRTTDEWTDGQSDSNKPPLTPTPVFRGGGLLNMGRGGGGGDNKV